MKFEINGKYFDPKVGGTYIVLAFTANTVTVKWLSVANPIVITFSKVLTTGDIYVGQATELEKVLL